MSALLVDPSAPQAAGQQSPGSPSSPLEGGPAPAPAEGRACAHCGAPLQEGQEWCTGCGACEPRSLQAQPGRRPLAALTLLAVLLAAGAAVAGAAALTRKPAPRRLVVAVVPPTPTTPTAPVPGGLTTGGAGAPKHNGSPNNLLFPPSSTAKPPKVPAASGGGLPSPSGASTGAEPGGSTGEPGGGESTTPETHAKGGGEGSTTTPETHGQGTESSGKEGAKSGPTPLLLDTDAATTYNPSAYPAAGFGDPALAIDGEPSTAWTAQVQPASFPSMAEGLLIDLRTPTRLGSLKLATPTRGVVVQVYGATGAKAPEKITDPGWTHLSGTHTLKKKVTHLRLRTLGKPLRFVLVWIDKAPAAAQGTAAAPGHVALSELVLYPLAS